MSICSLNKQVINSQFSWNKMLVCSLYEYNVKYCRHMIKAMYKSFGYQILEHGLTSVGDE